jgi:hypothetical protein
LLVFLLFLIHSKMTIIREDATITEPAEIDLGMGDEETPPFSVDLPGLYSKHVDFLRWLHEIGVTKRVTSESLRRYRNLWLPLIDFSYDDTTLREKDLIPPPDVAWLWHCHRLAPEAYKRFIDKEFSSSKGRYESTSIRDLNDPTCPYDVNIASNPHTKAIWREFYPYEPFLLSESADEEAVNGNENIRGFDLLASAKAQATFLWQVEHFTAAHDGGADESYLRFLKLNTTSKGGPLSFLLVPTLAIDLMWQTHMTGATPAMYRNDCIQISGRPLDHNYSLNGRAEGGENDVSFQKTGQLWKETYGDDGYTSRGGYRREPPASFFATPESITIVDPEDDDSNEKQCQEASIFAVVNPEDDYDSSEKQFQTRRRYIWGLAVFIGIILIIVKRINNPIVFKGYACGLEPPSLEEIQSRNVPVSVWADITWTDSYRNDDVSSSRSISRSLCLKAGEDPLDPPVWCYTNLFHEKENDKMFWLWWSPDTNGDTAWRLGQERDAEQTMYKLPTSQRPGPDDFPPAANNYNIEWQTNVFSDDWVEYDVSVYSKDDEGAIRSNGIPEDCYDDVLYISGTFIAGVLLTVVGSICLIPLIFPETFGSGSAGVNLDD